MPKYHFLKNDTMILDLYFSFLYEGGGGKQIKPCLEKISGPDAFYCYDAMRLCKMKIVQIDVCATSILRTKTHSPHLRTVCGTLIGQYLLPLLINLKPSKQNMQEDNRQRSRAHNQYIRIHQCPKEHLWCIMFSKRQFTSFQTQENKKDQRD